MAEESLPPAPVIKEREQKHSLPVLTKIAQVLLAVLIIGLIVDPFNSHLRILNQPKRNLDDVAIVYISVSGYLLINVIFIIGYFLGDRIPKKTSIMFSAVGACLHIVAANVMVHKWRRMTGSYIDYQSNNAVYSSKQYNDMLISGAVFTFINAIIFAADVLITMRLT
ncbi:uncharacterized protein LOC107044888 [Diachasma alloeum]|uniref:uncharacterized protein LOC107044888 n=1 Tax=Diachasma alloeum TaxID=454923 RepID=UPI000738249F|nr:uncharacterized protein LOC107044888 [Diachasma alloeum]XP_015122435.1 uncharacterized protein LOC107044888 [Diachasma alloeum]XP_015122436.1 uncharacterized protein LOC107044888 [Diachasma alloeum]